MCFQFYVALLFACSFCSKTVYTRACRVSLEKESKCDRLSSCRTIITTLLMPLPQLQLIPMPWT